MLDAGNREDALQLGPWQMPEREEFGEYVEA